MARRALVEILGEPSGFIESLKKSGAATEVFSGDLTKLAVNAKASADVQVAASVRKTERLRSEIAAYEAVARSAVRGSREEVAASNLAARAQLQLSRSMGVSTAESAALSRNAGHMERDLGRATRGALAGSGIFRGLGRSIAFASGGFLAFASAGQFVRTSIDAAKEAQVTQKQLGAQFRSSGLDLETYQGAIDKTANRLALLAGFENDEVKAGFTTIFRTTNNVSKALRDTATAADLARAKHLSFAQASLIVAKTEAGNTTLLRRQGLQIAKNATSEEALARLRQIVAGQAKAGTTAQERFGAVLHNTEEIIGTGILPTLNKYLASGAVWLTQMNDSGRLQKDVEQIMRDVTAALKLAGAAAEEVSAAFRTLNRVTGSAENTIKALGLAWLLLRNRTSLVTGEVVGLRGALMSLGGAGVLGALEALALKMSAVGKAFAFMGAELPALSDALKVIEGRNPFDTGQSKSGLTTAAQSLVYGRNGEFSSKLLSMTTSSKDAVLASRYGSEFSTPYDVIKAAAEGKISKKRFEDFTKALFKQDPALAHEALGRTATKYDFTTTRPPTPQQPVRGVDTPNRFSPAAAAAAAAAKGHPMTLLGQFNLDELKLANAQRANDTALQRQILASEVQITLKLADQAKTLKDRTKYVQQAASLQSSIDSLDQAAASKAQAAAAKAKAAADKRRAAAEQAALGGVPLSLQLAQAKADAIAAGTNAQTLTKGQRAAAEAIRTAEYQAIKSHRLSMQGLIDAWNEISTINSQLAGQTGKGMIDTYHHASTKALTAGVHLTRDAAITIRERQAQRDAHRGYVPNGPAALGQPVVHIANVHVNGVRNIDQLASELNKHARKKSRRGGR